MAACFGPGVPVVAYAKPAAMLTGRCCAQSAPGGGSNGGAGPQLNGSPVTTE